MPTNPPPERCGAEASPSVLLLAVIAMGCAIGIGVAMGALLASVFAWVAP